MTLRFVTVSVVLLLVGCSLHKPTQATLPVDLPPEFLEYRAVVETGLPIDQWWLSFNDEHLSKLMVELFDQNLELNFGGIHWPGKKT